LEKLELGNIRLADKNPMRHVIGASVDQIDRNKVSRPKENAPGPPLLLTGIVLKLDVRPGLARVLKFQRGKDTGKVWSGGVRVKRGR